MIISRDTPSWPEVVGMDANRKTSKDRGSRSISHSPSRKMSTEKADGSRSDGEGGLLLTNPMACEEDSPGSPRQTAAYVDKPATSKSSKSRPKSPSFLRLLVGSFRSKHGEATEEHPAPSVSPPVILQPAGSISDNEEVKCYTCAFSGVYWEMGNK